MQTLISLGGILSGPIALEALIFLRLHAHPMDRDMHGGKFGAGKKARSLARSNGISSEGTFTNISLIAFAIISL